MWEDYEDKESYSFMETVDGRICAVITFWGMLEVALSKWSISFGVVKTREVIG
jgi:hypothetical protein